MFLDTTALLNVGGRDGMVTLHIDPVQEISGDQTGTQTYYGQEQRGARNIRGDIGGFYILSGEKNLIRNWIFK